jgi:uncharacterized protein (TIGR02452 family)
MSIQLEFISLLIPRRVVEKHYPGGWEAYKRENRGIVNSKNYNVWYDDLLVKEGAMDPMSMEFLVNKWKDLGVKTVSDNGKKWVDVCVADQFGGPTLPCDWLVLNKNGTVSMKQDKQDSTGDFDSREWLREFNEAQAKHTDLHELRAQIFQGTVTWVKAGSYAVDGCKVKIDNSALVSEFFTRPPALTGSGSCKTQFSVLNADCLETAQLLDAAGMKPCVLNMANRRNPGGGVTGGAGAQEENIFRRTNLFYSLYCYASYAAEYGLTKAAESYPLDRDTGGIYTGNVTVFRAGEKNGYRLLKVPYKTAIVTVPAINRPDLVERDGVKYIADQFVEPTKEKMRTILRIAGKYEHDALVLGAFGCGAFRNPPRHVAELFKEVFTEPEFKDRFKTVVFAILDDHNSNLSHNPEGNVLPFLEVFDEGGN